MSSAAIVVALSCTRAAAVVLRVLYRLVVAVVIIAFDIMLTVLVVAVIDGLFVVVALAVVDVETSAVVETSALSSLLLKKTAKPTALTDAQRAAWAHTHYITHHGTKDDAARLLTHQNRIARNIPVSASALKTIRGMVIARVLTWEQADATVCCRLTSLVFILAHMCHDRAGVVTALSPLSAVLRMLLAVGRVLSDRRVIKLALRVRILEGRHSSELALTPPTLCLRPCLPIYPHQHVFVDGGWCTSPCSLCVFLLRLLS